MQNLVPFNGMALEVQIYAQSLETLPEHPIRIWATSTIANVHSSFECNGRVYAGNCMLFKESSPGTYRVIFRSQGQNGSASQSLDILVSLEKVFNLKQGVCMLNDDEQQVPAPQEEAESTEEVAEAEDTQEIAEFTAEQQENINKAKEALHTSKEVLKRAKEVALRAKLVLDLNLERTYKSCPQPHSQQRLKRPPQKSGLAQC
ncbi:hypothetical protein HHE06_06170 [Helicobacter heilmannii]|uniref:hypothetical protein n=1 Tax=Helicobacter heilmannii TaxID=35817 RepID=UPI0006A1B784|nr:hypothetical protein [Helicobacter heilmannii]CRF50772.1 hypothetical protein HHE06_06170 [Helicobacter heilmannii]